MNNKIKQQKMEQNPILYTLLSNTQLSSYYIIINYDGVSKQMADPIFTVVRFIVSVIISTIIIYIVTKLFGEKEGIKQAFITAIIGAIVYGIVYFLLGRGIVAAIVGGIVWLLALRALYSIGWLKALVIAVIVWIAAMIVDILLPTVPGPL
jgi:uncharacterized membrane protein YvlD (DUF360 family)